MRAWAWLDVPGRPSVDHRGDEPSDAFVVRKVILAEERIPLHG